MNKPVFFLDAGQSPWTTNPPLLVEKGQHQIYWIGMPDEDAFRCNTYLVVDGDEALLIDPGSILHYDYVLQRVSDIIAPSKIKGMVLCHQDPDVASSMPAWLKAFPDMLVISSGRTNVLLPHYGASNYTFYDIVLHPIYTFASGASIRFTEAPFLHFPGAFTSFDVETGVLFSGDIWAALDTDFTSVVQDFNSHALKMDLFHLDYMASNIATKGFANRIKHLPINAIFPQHGALIPSNFVKDAIRYLENVSCGLDLIYPSY
jgi:flavorubredoxin